MAEVALKVEKREIGKRAAKDVRNAGKIPGVYYIKGQEGTPITASPLDLRPIVYTSQTKVVNLDLDGEVKKCVLKDVDLHPITDEVLHFDLLGLQDDHKITVKVPFKFTGRSKGVVAGGVFQQVLLNAKISCLPKDLPSFIEVDITNLAQGQALYLEAVKEQNPNLDFAIKGNTVICRIAKPRVSAADKAAEDASNQ